MSYPIHIAFCGNDRYMPYIAVAVRSIADAHVGKNVTVHILSDDVSDMSIARIKREVSDFADIELRFHIVDLLPIEGLVGSSIYLWLRLLIPQTLDNDIHRVLYLDADTLVMARLDELFTMPLDGLAMAAVEDPQSFDQEIYSRLGTNPANRYVCSGVLLFNLDYCRNNNIANEIIIWSLNNHEKLKFPDQDAINIVCNGAIGLLPLRYGVVDALYTVPDVWSSQYSDQIRESFDSPAIIHYAGSAPWLRDGRRHPMADRWYAVNSTMKRPAKMTYKSRGLLRLKIMLWNMLHPGHIRSLVSTDEIRQRLGI